MPLSNALEVQTESDEALLQGIARQRDGQCFSKLFERHQQPAYNLALHISRDSALAEEAVQEAMLMVWTSADHYLEQGLARNWILKIVARCSIRALRGRKREKIRIEKKQRMTSVQAINPVDSSLEGSETHKILRDCIAQLDDESRELIGLYFGGELSQEEIGKALNLPQYAISRKITKIVENLRMALGSAGFVVVPILGDALIREALLGGHQVPQGLLNKLLSQLNTSQPSRGWMFSRTKWLVMGTSALILVLLGFWISAELAKSTVSVIATAPPELPPESDVIYVDNFSNAELDTFWSTRCEPGWFEFIGNGGQVKRQPKPTTLSGTGPAKSWLTLDANGIAEDSKAGMAAVAEVVSKQILLGDQNIFLDIDTLGPIGKGSFEYGLDMLDESGKTIMKQSILITQLESGKFESQVRYQTWSKDGDKVKFGSRQLLTQLPNVRFKLGNTPEIGKDAPGINEIREKSAHTSSFQGKSPIMKAIRVRLFLRVEGGGSATWPIEGMMISRKGVLPHL